MKYFLCYRIKDLPYPHYPSVKRRCIYCKKDVWLAKKTMKKYGDNPCICPDCLDKRRSNMRYVV